MLCVEHLALEGEHGECDERLPLRGKVRHTLQSWKPVGGVTRGHATMDIRGAPLLPSNFAYENMLE